MDSHLIKLKNDIFNNGYTVVENIYTETEVNEIIALINSADQSNPAFRKTKDLFAIRQFLKEIPKLKSLVFNERLCSLVKELFGKDFFIVKSIYFDKPEASNWFVAYHQDLTIAVDKKTELFGYGPWTVKLEQFAVQPPVNILQNNFTIRIHLDDTNENNGALKVIRGSHSDIKRPSDIDWNKEKVEICNVKRGGVNIMRPLIMHASNRSTANKRRRVIHLEFSDADLPSGINWVEKETYL